MQIIILEMTPVSSGVHCVLEKEVPIAVENMERILHQDRFR